MKRIFMGALLLVTSFITKAQTVDEIVNKHIEAIGGAAALDRLQSVVKEGNLNAQGYDVAIVMTQVANKAYKMDISVMGMNAYQIVTPKEGWSFMPFNGETAPRTLTEDELKDGLDNLDPQGALYNYAKKGHQVSLVGSDKLEGKECFELSVTTVNGKKRTYYIDKSTYFIIKGVSIKEDKNEEYIYSNYKAVDGVQFAHTTVRPQGELNFSKITVNGKVDESIFKPSN